MFSEEQQELILGVIIIHAGKSEMTVVKMIRTIWAFVRGTRPRVHICTRQTRMSSWTTFKKFLVIMEVERCLYIQWVSGEVL